MSGTGRRLDVGGDAYIAGRDMHLHIPRALRRALIAFLVLVVLAGAGWAVVVWVLPQFAPTYKTMFLVDAADEGASEVSDVSASLRTIVANSGDRDALALRSFGGECGAPDNTTRHVDFATGNREELAKAASGVRRAGRATLQRGVVQAVEDFAEPFARRAKQVNRIIVVTRHGADACDPDAGFVERDVRQRIAGAGLAIEFRLIGYQVPAAERAGLAGLATGASAPAPAYVETPAQLQAALDWYANVEPVLRNAKRIIDVLDPTVTRVNEATKAVVDRRLDVAERALDDARSAITRTEVDFEDLAGRTSTPAARDIHNRATNLRAQQGRVVDSAAALLRSARDKKDLGPGLASFAQVADTYNTEVNAMNQALATLRALAPESAR